MSEVEWRAETVPVPGTLKSILPATTWVGSPQEVRIRRAPVWIHLAPGVTARGDQLHGRGDHGSADHASRLCPGLRELSGGLRALIDVQAWLMRQAKFPLGAPKPLPRRSVVPP